MAVRGPVKHDVATSGRNSRRRLGCLAAVLLALAACSPGGTPPGTSPSGSSAPPAPASPSIPGSAVSPSKPFSDAELAAIINGVGQTRKLPFPAAQDSTRLRSGAASGSFPQTDTKTTPADCIAFVPQDPFTRWADKDINFAEGAMPPAGGQSGPTSTIMIVLRSADQDAIARADFGYADDLPSRCSQFDLAYTESGRTSTYAVQLLAAPPIADKQYAVTQAPSRRARETSPQLGCASSTAPCPSRSTSLWQTSTRRPTPSPPLRPCRNWRKSSSASRVKLPHQRRQQLQTQ